MIIIINDVSVEGVALLVNKNGVSDTKRCESDSKAFPVLLLPRGKTKSL